MDREDDVSFGQRVGPPCRPLTHLLQGGGGHIPAPGTDPRLIRGRIGAGSGISEDAISEIDEPHDAGADSCNDDSSTNICLAKITSMNPRTHLISIPTTIPLRPRPVYANGASRSDLSSSLQFSTEIDRTTSRRTKEQRSASAPESILLSRPLEDVRGVPGPHLIRSTSLDVVHFRLKASVQAVVSVLQNPIGHHSSNITRALVLGFNSMLC